MGGSHRSRPSTPTRARVVDPGISKMAKARPATRTSCKVLVWKAKAAPSDTGAGPVAPFTVSCAPLSVLLAAAHGFATSGGHLGGLGRLTSETPATGSCNDS